MKRAAIALGVVAVFVAVVAATLPVDALLRRALASAAPPGGPTVTFARAVLRPAGIVLEDAALHAPDGTALAATSRLTAWPSIGGLFGGTSGFPWTLHALVCDTPARVTVASVPGGTALDLRWQDADLARCRGAAIGGGTLLGHAESTAQMTFAATASGQGDVAVRDVLWKGGPGTAGFALRAAVAQAHWTLADERVELTGVVVHGPDLEAVGGGEVRFAKPFGASTVDIRLEVAPGASATSLIRAVLALLPPMDADRSHRRLVVTGTVDRPQVLR